MKLFVDVARLHSILWRPAASLELFASIICCFFSRIAYLSSSGFSSETP